MARKKANTARIENLKKAREAKNNRPILEIFETIFGLFLCGLTYQCIKNFYTAISKPDRIIPEKKFYEAQKIVIDKFIKEADKNCEIYRKKIKQGAIIAFDGSWDHRRNGRFCIVEAIDIEQKKL